MVVTGHWAIQQAIQQGLAQYQANASALTPEIFADAPSAIQAEIQATLGNPATRIPVQLGYPLTTPPQLPGIWVYSQAGGEQIGRDVIGQTYQVTLPSTGQGQTAQAVAARWTWAILVASVNANESLALDALVLWALVTQRQALGDALGAYLLQIGWGAWGPLPNSAGDVVFPFARTLTLTADAYLTWATPVGTITSGAATTQP